MWQSATEERRIPSPSQHQAHAWLISDTTEIHFEFQYESDSVAGRVTSKNSPWKFRILSVKNKLEDDKVDHK